MSQLNIRVGASIDRSMQVAFRPLIESAKRAKSAIEAESKKAGRAISTETKKGVDEAERKFRELEHEVMTGLPKAMNAGSAAVKKFAAETKSSFDSTKKSFNDLAREAEGALAKIERSQKRVAGMSLGAKLGAVAGKAYDWAGGNDGAKAGLSRGGRMALGVGKAAAGKAFQLAKALGSSAGMDFDVESVFKKNVDLETTATQLSASGYNPNDKHNSRRVDPSVLMREALQLGSETGTDANTALEGLGKFVAKTGDLARGREIMKDLSVLAKATGTSLEDMTDAAGDVASALPDSATKGKEILTVMRAVAGGGKLGAIEMKDFASQMAKVAANAGAFNGKASDNMITLAAMAQESRQRGGSSSATQAATSVASFVSMLKTPKRAEEFEKATHTKVFDQKTGKLRDPQAIIKEALQAVGTDPLKLKTIFANVQGARAMEGFATLFREKGGGKAGLDAVDDEFKRLKEAAMAQAEIDESFARAMKTSASQAEVFNNAIRLSAAEVQTSLMPAIMQLAPQVVAATRSFAGVISWLTGDKQLEVISGQAETDTKNVKKSIETQLKGGNQVSEVTVDDARVASNEAFEALSRAKAELATSKDNANAAKVGGWGEASDLLTGSLLGWTPNTDKAEETAADVKTKQENVAKMEQLYAEASATNKELLSKIKDGTIQVKVMNPEDLNPQGPNPIDNSGRTPPPGPRPRK